MYSSSVRSLHISEEPEHTWEQISESRDSTGSSVSTGTACGSIGLERARERMKAHGLGAMLCMYDENVRYITGTLTPGWNRLKPGLRYAMLCGDDPPVLFEQGDLGFQIERHSPWIPKENVRWSYAWIKGAAGPASHQQVEKFTQAIIQEMKKSGVGGQKLGVDFIDINMIQAFKDANIEWVDGMSAMMEARAVKNVDEQECLRIVGAIGDAAHWETMKFLRPGVTENQVTAHIMKFLYSIPGMEDVEDVIVSSGPEHLAELAQLLRPHHSAGRHRVHGSRRADVERLQVVLLPHVLRRQGAEPGAEGRLRHGAQVAVRLDRRREGRHDDARDRVQVAVSEGGVRLRGRGSGRGQPVGPRPRPRAVRSRRSSRASGRSTTRSRSRPGWCSPSRPSTARCSAGASASRRCSSSTRTRIEIISNFPVKQITVVDPMPGYGDTSSE